MDKTYRMGIFNVKVSEKFVDSNREAGFIGITINAREIFKNNYVTEDEYAIVSINKDWLSKFLGIKEITEDVYSRLHDKKYPGILGISRKAIIEAAKKEKQLYESVLYFFNSANDKEIPEELI
jgi:hypothetical protein